MSKIKLFIATFLATFLLSAPCFAANGSIVLKTDRTDLSNGEEITITADLPDDQKIYAMTATLQYDENVFEPIDNYNFSIPDTAALSYNAQNNQFGIVNQTGAVEDDMLVVRLKVKDDANVGNTNIALTNISTSDGQTKTEYSTASTQILVTHDAAEGETVPTNSENAIVESTTETPNVLFTTPFIIAAVVMVGVIILVAILYFGNLTPHTSKLYYSLVCLGVVIVVLTVAVGVISNNKKDVNGDGQVGYDDAQSIIDYLIDLRGENEGENSENSDGNASTDSGNSNSGHYVIGFNGNYGPGRNHSSNASSNTVASANGVTNNNSSASGNPSDSTSGTTPGNPSTGGSSSGGPSTGGSSSNPRPPHDYDTDNDGDVDINDAGHNTEEADKNTSVALSAAKNQDYLVNKNHDNLMFMAKIEPKEVKLAKVKIGGQAYDADEMDNGEYMVKIDPALLASAGEHTLKIESVETTNHKTFDTNHEVKFEVRKDVPKIEEFEHDQLNEKISFRIYDPDGALQEGRTYIYNDSDFENPLKTQDINKDDLNEVEHDFDENTAYLIDIRGNYCRTIATDDKGECYQDASLHSHSFAMGEDYGFTLDNFSLSDYVEPGKQPLMNFHSTNTKDATVSQVKVKVGETEHMLPVTLQDDENYEVVLEGVDTKPGRHTVTLESVDLNNAQIFHSNIDFKVNELSYFVPKNVPKVDNLALSSDKNNKIIKANFDLADVDGSVSQLTLILTDSTNRSIETKTIPRDEFPSNNKFSIDLSYGSARDKSLKVEVYADYDLGDKYNFTNINLATSGIDVFEHNDLYIDKITSRNMLRNNGNGEETRYADKGQKKFQLLFKLVKNVDLYDSTNTKYSTNTAYTVNGANYTSFGPGGDVYNAAVSIGIPDAAGVVNLEVTRTQYAINAYYHKTSDWFSIPKRDYRIEVLKDKPAIQNFRATEDAENHSVTFKFDVVLDPTAVENDESFKSGAITLGKQSRSIHRGTNEITFENVPANESQSLVIKASYDLDTDALNEEDGNRDLNEYNDATLYETTYGLFDKDIFKDVKITNAEALTNSKENNNDKFFEKNEQIGLYFTISGIPAEINRPQKIALDGKAWEYELIQIVNDKNEVVPDEYAVFIPGYDDAGNKSVRVTSITLQNGQTINLGDDQTKSPSIDFEVLKDELTVTDFQYQVDGAEIILTSKLTDKDHAVLGKPHLTIFDELDQKIYDGEYQSKLTIDNKGESLLYVKVTADYSRITNPVASESGEYQHNNVELLNTTISLENNKIELKDIKDISLYRVETNGDYTLTDEISKEEINQNPDQYFVEIAMDNAPTVRLKVKNAQIIDENALYLVLESEYITAPNEQQTLNNNLALRFGEIDSNTQKAKNTTHPDQILNEFLDKLKNNQDITLTQDVDMSIVAAPSNIYYVSEYTGTLDGNGHTISGLKRQLASTMKNATIKNVTFKNVDVAGAVRGIFANEAINTTLENVHLYDSTMTANSTETGTGMFFGNTKENVTISKTSIVNSRLSGGKRTGGFVGWVYGAADINNSYINDSEVICSWDAGGGIVGETTPQNGGQILLNNLYAKFTLTASGNNGGFWGWANGGVTKLSNSIGMASGKNSHRIRAHGGSAENVFEIKESELTSNQNGNAIKSMSKDEVNANLFTDTLKWDNQIWDLKDATYDTPPVLQGEDFTTHTKYSSAKDYNVNKEAIYDNVAKLIPYYSTDKIVKEGNDAKEIELTTKQIQHLVPLDADGGFVPYLTTNNQDKIKKLRIVFSDGTTETYDTIYTKTYDMVASYRIPKLHVDYNYPRYVIDANSRTVDNLVYYLKNFSYNNNLDTLTAADDSRIYRDFYNDVTSKELKEFVLKYLANSDYTNTSSIDALNGQIERSVKKDNRLARALYVYNYLRRFYDLDINGSKLYDLVLFDMNGFSDQLTPAKIVDAYFSDENNFLTGRTHTAYRNVYSKYTNLGNISKFLEFAVQKLGGSDQPMSEWVHDQFKGFLAERSIDNKPDYSSDGKVPVSTSPFKDQDTEVRYTLWDHLYYPDALQNSDTSYNVYNYVLPILTLPENSTYIISTPVQFIIGSQNTYLDPTDSRGADAARDAFNFRVNAYANRMKTYFTTAYGLIQNKDIFNNMNLYQLDKIWAIDENGVSTKQRPGSTEDPHHKNFNEVVGRFSADGGINAGAYSDRVEFDVAGVMDATIKEVADYLGLESYTENTFGTWSHESAHMIDARLWLENNGRRWDAGGEDYADGNLRQEFDANLIVMNLTRDLGEKCPQASNCTPERIDTQDEVHDFYKKAFDVIYVMDYIQGLAFLQLTPEQKAQVGTQVSYPDESKYINDETNQHLAYKTSQYNWLTAEQWADLKLETVEDLYNNKIMLYPGYYKQTSRGSNSYGGEGINTAHWYQPHNEYGRPDSYSLKWLAYEMMGYAGYDKGYVRYYSNIENVGGKKTDAIIQSITGYKTFDEYKLARFKEAEENLKKLNKVVDVKAYVEKFYNAMVKDAEDQKANIAKKFADKGSEEACLADYWCMHGWRQGQPGYSWYGILDYVSQPANSKARQEFYQALKQITNDFTGDDIFLTTSQQNFSDVNELRHLMEKRRTATTNDIILSEPVTIQDIDNTTTQQDAKELEATSNDSIEPKLNQKTEQLQPAN